MEKEERLFSGEFEFIDSGASEGGVNMHFDEERVALISAGAARPMFRLYAWSPWCLSLGANQRIDTIDEEACRAGGFSIVRRATGGRAVFHADELTYSIVTRLGQGQTIQDIYRLSHEFLLRAIDPLCGSRLGFERSQPDFRSNYKNFLPSVSCFASSARYEIIAGGKKVVGSAQRLYGDILLQHGSILLGPGHEQLADLVKFSDEAQREAFRASMLSKSTSLGETAGRTISYEDCAGAISRRFMQEQSLSFSAEG